MYLFNIPNHPFHLVDQSPWSLLNSLSMFSFMMGLIKWFHFNGKNLLYLSLMLNMLIMYQWWRDMSRESTFQGLHTMKITMGLRWGMMLFITSEISFL